jgi:hypothetical protein
LMADAGKAISQIMPADSKLILDRPPVSIANARSIRRVPNPLRVGGLTEGPPASRQVR